MFSTISGNLLLARFPAHKTKCNAFEKHNDGWATDRIFENSSFARNYCYAQENGGYQEISA
jgi:hypothetical protein